MATGWTAAYLAEALSSIVIWKIWRVMGHMENRPIACLLLQMRQEIVGCLVRILGVCLLHSRTPVNNFVS